MSTSNLRLLTINTWRGDGYYWLRIEALKNELQRLRPTIVTCQEVFQCEEAGADTANQLATFLGMHQSVTPARWKLRSFAEKAVKSYSGLAVLSTQPIAQTWVQRLPTDPRDGERLAQYCRIIIDSVPVLMINTHLTHLRDSSLLRKQQIDALLSHPALIAHQGPSFLCGDFNAVPQSAEIQYLLTQAAFSVQDAYTLGHGERPGLTVLPPVDSPALGKRIDYIFSVAQPGKEHPSIAEARVVLNQADETGTYPSDHFGVMIQTQPLQP